MIAIGWLAVTAPLSQVAPAADAAVDHPDRRRRHADRAARRDHRRAGRRRQAAARTSPRPSSRSRTAASTRIGASIRAASRAPSSHNIGSGGVREGGSTITQQLAKNAFLDSDRTAARKIREVMIAFWLEAWLTKDEILVALSVERLFRRQCLRPARRRRSIISTASREKLNVGQAAMLAGLVKAPSRLAPTSNLAGRARARRAGRRGDGRSRLHHQGRGAPRSSRSACWPAGPTTTADRHLFRRLGAARRARPGRRDQGRGDGRRPRSTAGCSAPPSARAAAPGCGRRRSRWSRCAPTAASSRWSAARITPRARSTARRRRGASRARPSSCSSISPRCAPG